jgi:hypothetical protein
MSNINISNLAGNEPSNTEDSFISELDRNDSNHILGGRRCGYDWDYYRSYRPRLRRRYVEEVSYIDRSTIDIGLTIDRF